MLENEKIEMEKEINRLNCKRNELKIRLKFKDWKNENELKNIKEELDKIEKEYSKLYLKLSLENRDSVNIRWLQSSGEGAW